MNQITLLEAAYRRKVFFTAEHFAAARAVQRRMTVVEKADEAVRLARLGAALLQVLDQDEKELVEIRRKIRELKVSR